MRKNQRTSQWAYFRIIGKSHLDFADIEHNLLITPDRKIKKGEKYKIVTAENDSLIYETTLNEDEDIYEAIRRKAREFLIYKDYLAEISKKYLICLTISIQSEFAEVCFELPPDIVKLLASLGISIEFSVFSWGGVIGDG
ncbi:MAG: DUF4279 domain-containing protein [Clostridiales bacterium]|jgi:hypothetical protein|nr:DUF4279 domain-containing protein [Clostridiales bacterium]